jgi:asparagine synthase (glutamine-hydrolysing)
MFSAPIWWHLFESYDPGVTQVAQEVRHPLIDLRLVRYILSIPPVPWCDEKHILREAMANVLPAEVLRRPKTALAGDPAVERVRSGDLQGLEAPSPIPEFARYIDEGALARAAVALEPHALWQRLIPECLDRWLEQQRYREILRPGHRVESETSLVGA